MGAVPAGLVHVVGGGAPSRSGLVGDLDDYWIDRFEITNRRFKEFVDQGGYRRRDYWREPFIESGRSLSWEEAIERFRDATGRPGPATWRAGTYADGQADFPVGGVSWYEAAAYAAFAGKTLPTIHHWYRAAWAERKQHRVFETGHALPIEEVAREILPWLDRYLGQTRIPAANSGR